MADLRLRPLLRWAGSKQRLLPVLTSLVPCNIGGRYVEPFSGSASLFFSLDPDRALLGDINTDLIDFYRHVRWRPKALHSALLSIPRTRRQFASARRRYMSTTSSLERSTLFWYLNRTCFNGLYRTNKRGEFNVPFGSKLPPYPALESVGECARRLRKAELYAGDFSQVVRMARAKDFLYVDPPYRRNSNRDRGEYGPGAMQDADLSRLLTDVKKASDRGAKVLLSYNRSLRRLLPDWEHHSVRGRHLISGDPNFRPPMTEYIALNYRLPSPPESRK